jgi:hypothetical protein
MGDGASIGVPVFTGRLFVKKANKKSISTFLVVDGLSREVEKKFENVDMGVYYLGTPLLIENVMTTTTTNPMDAPFIFFPVINETLFKQYEGTENIEKMLYGNRWGASRVTFLTGMIAEAAIWNSALSLPEIVSLSKGFSPNLISPQNLVFYNPCVRDFKDVRQGRVVTSSGVTVSNHPRIYY